jgi:hypothetical protein
LSIASVILRAKKKSPLARTDGLHDRGDWKANGTAEIAAEKRGLVEAEIALASRQKM